LNLFRLSVFIAPEKSEKDLTASEKEEELAKKDVYEKKVNRNGNRDREKKTSVRVKDGEKLKNQTRIKKIKKLRSLLPRSRCFTQRLHRDPFD
jgi:hypothetical protein